MIVGFLLAIVTAVVIMMATPGINQITAAQIGLLVGELFLPIPIFIWAKKYQADMRRLLRLNPVALSAVAASVPLAIGLTIVTDELDRIAQSLVSVPAEFSKIQEIMTITDPFSAFVIIGVVIIIAPFVEELIFRGFFQRILEYRLKDITKAVLYSALTFAIIHFNPWWVVQIYIIGVFMGYVAWRTDSIWISFILHAINNGIAVIFTHLPENSIGWYEWRGHVSPTILVAGVLLLAGGIRWFIRSTPIRPKSEEAMPIEDLFGVPPGRPR
ncbi:MAG: type II CAAX endopeptidase family protein [Candidatus Marinimicrobia bacterium]|nr:type II CAAX endopeptidase family protein [Candidatus Neomarinimicrobiota bacterium]